MTKARDEVAQNRQAADFMRPGDDGYYTLTALPPHCATETAFRHPCKTMCGERGGSAFPSGLAPSRGRPRCFASWPLPSRRTWSDWKGSTNARSLPPAPDDVSLDAPLPKVLFIRSNPPGARITLDGREVGRTPYAQGYTSAGGHINVRIEAKGYVPWLSTVDLSEAGAGLDVDLKPRRKRDMPALALAHTGG